MRLFQIIIILFAFAPEVCAQWESLEGPYGGFVNDLKANSEGVFAAVPDGLFYSNDHGLTWSVVDLDPGRHLAVLSIGILGEKVLVDAIDITDSATHRRLFRSMDSGITWQEVARPASDQWFSISITPEVVILDGYQEEGQVVYLSFDAGNSWQAFQGFESPFFRASIVTNSNYAYSANESHLFSYSLGEGLMDLHLLPTEIRVASSLYADDDRLFLIDVLGESLWRSEDGGLTWMSVSQDRWRGDDVICRLGETYYAFHRGWIYISSDNGDSWTSVTDLQDFWVRRLISFDSVLLAGSYYAGIYRSVDEGNTFVLSSDGIHSAHCRNLANYNGQLLVSADYMGVYNYDLTEAGWRTDYLSGMSGKIVDDLVIFDGRIWALDGSNLYGREPDAEQWVEFGYVGTSQEGPEGWVIDAKMFIGGNRYLFDNKLVFVPPGSTEASPFKVYAGSNLIWPSMIARSDPYYFVSDGRQILRSASITTGYEVVMPEFDVGLEGYARITSLQFVGDRLFAGFHNVNFGTSYLFMSADQGMNWQSADAGLGMPDGGDSVTALVRGIIQVDNFLVGWAYGLGVVTSATDPIAWRTFNDGMGRFHVTEVLRHGNYLYAATNGHGVYRRRLEDLALTRVTGPESSINFKLIPNPADDMVTVSLDMPGKDIQLTVWSSSGRLMNSLVFSGETQGLISTRDWPSGVYFVHAVSQGRRYMRQLIVTH